MTFSFSGVLLDLDGLLLDTERLQYEVGPAVLRNMGHEVPTAFFQTLVGVDRATSARLLSQQVGAEIILADLDTAWNAAMNEKMLEAIPLRPGVHDFLDILDRAGLPRAVATNSITERAQAKLSRAGLLDRVHMVIGVDQVAKGKPAPDVYLAAAASLGLQPAQCIALDDSDLGVKSAVAAGVGLVIQIPDLVEPIELGAHHRASSLAEAAAIVGL